MNFGHFIFLHSVYLHHMLGMSTTFEDKYALLQIAPTASTQEINKAFRSASLLCHPDKLAPEERETGEAKFKQLSAAREVLVYPESRAKYDAEWRRHYGVADEQKRESSTEQAPQTTTNGFSYAPGGRSNPGFSANAPAHADRERWRPVHHVSETHSQRTMRMRHDASARSYANDKGRYEASMRAKDEQELREFGTSAAPKPKSTKPERTASFSTRPSTSAGQETPQRPRTADSSARPTPTAAAASSGIPTPPSTGDSKRKWDSENDEDGNGKKLKQ